MLGERIDNFLKTHKPQRTFVAVMLLQDAAQGQMYDFLTLAEEMEEREGQYRSVLSTRKGAIKSIEPFVKSPTEDKDDELIADAAEVGRVQQQTGDSRPAELGAGDAGTGGEGASGRTFLCGRS